MQLDLILVVGCAELPPSGRGRCLNFVFSNGAHWNNRVNVQCQIDSFCVTDFKLFEKWAF